MRLSALCGVFFSFSHDQFLLSLSETLTQEFLLLFSLLLFSFFSVPLMCQRCPAGGTCNPVWRISRLCLCSSSYMKLVHYFSATCKHGSPEEQWWRGEGRGCHDNRMMSQKGTEVESHCHQLLGLVLSGAQRKEAFSVQGIVWRAVSNIAFSRKVVGSIFRYNRPFCDELGGSLCQGVWFSSR